VPTGAFPFSCVFFFFFLFQLDLFNSFQKGFDFCFVSCCAKSQSEQNPKAIRCENLI